MKLEDIALGIDNKVEMLTDKGINGYNHLTGCSKASLAALCFGGAAVSKMTKAIHYDLLPDVYQTIIISCTALMAPLFYYGINNEDSKREGQGDVIDQRNTYETRMYKGLGYFHLSLATSSISFEILGQTTEGENMLWNAAEAIVLGFGWFVAANQKNYPNKKSFVDRIIDKYHEYRARSTEFAYSIGSTALAFS